MIEVTIEEQKTMADRLYGELESIDGKLDKIMGLP